MAKTVVGFMDTTDFYHELGEALGGVVVYGSMAEIKEYSPCVKECGIVRVEVSLVDTVQSPDSSQLKRISEDFDEDAAMIVHLTERVEQIRKLLSHCEGRLRYYEEKKRRNI